MKTAVFMTCMLSCFALVAAESVVGVDAHNRAKVLRPRRNRLAEAGGIVSKPVVGKVILFKNESSFPDDKISPTIEAFNRFTTIAMISGEPVDNQEVSAKICLVDEGDSLAIDLSENGAKAQFSVAALKADNPAENLLTLRLVKQAWRASMLVLGTGYSAEPGSVMARASTLSELDKLPPLPGPTSINSALAAAKQMGLAHSYSCTYRQALKEGWAPVPKTDIQKALWEEFHAKPTEPIKIEFDPKKSE